jgi:pyruvate-ferredoxin/flavodoxin oxidoreductase
VLRGSAQNPDVFFQAREASNPFYAACPGIVQETMRRFAARTGREYRLFDYFGAPDAERVIVLMGSGAEVVHECVEAAIGCGEKVGVVKVRLYRPFDAAAFVRALPRSVRAIAVLDRTKEPGGLGEPLYLDVRAALAEAQESGETVFATAPRVVGGRYGLSSKEFTPAMARAVFATLAAERPRNHFTVGIHDDVTHTSLDWDARDTTEASDVYRAIFYGLGSDGTVGANKNSIRIVGDNTPLHVQGYFVYDSKKAGAVTVSHLRFGRAHIRSAYTIRQAHFVACHHPQLLQRHDVLDCAMPGGVFLLNTPEPPERVWDTLPREAQAHILSKKLRFHVIDAFRIAHDLGIGDRINTIMQTCFFLLTDLLPIEAAIGHIKQSIEKTYGAKGQAIVQVNHAAVDAALTHLHAVRVPLRVTSQRSIVQEIPAGITDFARRVTLPLLAGQGDALPVSALPCDGTFPLGTARLEKRGLAHEIPIWDADLCVQCGKCAIVCPHAAIRSKVFAPSALAGAPDEFSARPVRGKDFEAFGADWSYAIQVAPDDCTGCGICVEVCPAKGKEEVRHKAIDMLPAAPHRDRERTKFAFFLEIPEADRSQVKTSSVRGSQVLEPLFEFSGACAGCGETPYVKLVSQLFGDRALIANATGCSSIYGGNLPTTPWSTNRDGRGPAWSNSLFEDNAEFGLGFRVSLDQQESTARRLLETMRQDLEPALVDAILCADQHDEAGIYEQRQRVAELNGRLAGRGDPDAEHLRAVADALVRKSVWLIGGDGWAYDIGSGGLDHVLASGRNVNVLVLDTEVYSNTGGQASKSTPRAAVAKFAAAGKDLPKKDLALLAMTYGHVYVASVALGANDAQTVRAFLEADAFDGPSLILAYSHCIAHGIRMRTAMQNQRLAVQSGHWPLFRYNPHDGGGTLRLDSREPSIPFEKYAYAETRYKMLLKAMPERARDLMHKAEADAAKRWRLYERIAAASKPSPPSDGREPGAAPAQEKAQEKVHG